MVLFYGKASRSGRKGSLSTRHAESVEIEKRLHPVYRSHTQVADC